MAAAENRKEKKKGKTKARQRFSSSSPPTSAKVNQITPLSMLMKKSGFYKDDDGTCVEVDRGILDP